MSTTPSGCIWTRPVVALVAGKINWFILHNKAIVSALNVWHTLKCSPQVRLPWPDKMGRWSLWSCKKHLQVVQKASSLKWSTLLRGTTLLGRLGSVVILGEKGHSSSLVGRIEFQKATLRLPIMFPGLPRYFYVYEVENATLYLQIFKSLRQMSPKEGRLLRLLSLAVPWLLQLHKLTLLSSETLKNLMGLFL